MSYVYAAMWIGCGLILIFRMAKENRVFYAAGAFFMLLGLWQIAAKVFGWDPSAGAAGWVQRAVTAALVVVLCLVYAKENRKAREKKPPDGGPRTPDE